MILALKGKQTEIVLSSAKLHAHYTVGLNVDFGLQFEPSEPVVNIQTANQQ